MTNEQIKYSIETGRIKLKKWDKFSHYGIVAFLYYIPTLFLIIHLIDYFQGTPRPFREGEIWFMIIPSILGLLFYRIQKNRLKFKSIDTMLTRKEIDVVIDNVANKLEWKIFMMNKKVLIAYTNPSFFTGSWGEQITILFDKNRILVNSICDPKKRSSVVSMGRNKQNIKLFIEEIKKAAENRIL